MNLGLASGGGFLGTGASLAADLVLVAEVMMGVALLVGMLLARRRHYLAHAWCQSAVVLLNLVVIGFTMAPSFRSQLIPKIPAGLRRSYYGIATAHAMLGSVAELLALYILIAAGTSILPRKLRLTRYKLWMRTALVIWWVVVLLGVTTYIRWYASHPAQRTAPSTRK